MKKQLLTLIMTFCLLPLFAQWVQVNSGLGNYPPASMFAFADTIVLGTYGGGVFRTLDNGDNWVDVNGDLGSLNVKDVRYGPASQVIFVATADGPYFTQDLSHYENCTSTGLTNTDINYFWFGGDDDNEWAVGTNGGGVFASPDYSGPWTARNAGVSGNGLIVNDMGGYSDNSIDYVVMGTDNGMYYSTDNLMTWTEKNNGLTGDALLVNKLTGLGSMVIIATDNGLFMSYDSGDTWTELIAGERLNTVIVFQSALSSTGFYCFAFGENGYYSEDFFSYSPVNLGGLSGSEITCAAVNSTHMFLGTTISDRSGGGIFRKPLDLVVGTDEEKYLPEHSGQLNQNYPNPFSASTTISYSMEKPGDVEIRVYNTVGQEVDILKRGFMPAGVYNLNYTPEMKVPGIYYYTLEIDGVKVAAEKMIME